MANVSKLKIGDTSYDVCDSTARNDITQINNDFQKGKLRQINVRKTINLSTGWTTTVEVDIPTGVSAVMPIFARLSSTSKPLVLYNIYTNNGKFYAAFINVGNETITITDALFEITYWSID